MYTVQLCADQLLRMEPPQVHLTPSSVLVPRSTIHGYSPSCESLPPLWRYDHNNTTQGTRVSPFLTKARSSRLSPTPHSSTLGT